MKYYTILLTTIFLSSIYSLSINDKAIKNINKAFPDLVEIQSFKLKIKDEEISTIKSQVNQNFYTKELYGWKIITNDNREYIAILDNVLGKSMPITFLAIFNKNRSVHNISIIKYREPYGGEIRSKRWLRQFENFNHFSNYKIGESIDGISGATISTKSISKGINKLTLLLELKHDDLSIISNE